MVQEIHGDDDRRFWSHVDKGSAAPCWVWRASIHKYGYGLTSMAGATKLAHRVAYEMTKGPIPAGLVLDHLCVNPPCVNPEHLEAVTQRTNVMRGSGPSAANAAKTECPQGHAYDGANTYIDKNSKRSCRRCGQDRAARRRSVKDRVS